MPTEIATLEDLERVKRELIEAIKSTHISTNPKSDCLKSKDVREMLGISPGKLQTLRINRTIAFTKVGGTFFYNIKDLEKVLNNNKREAKKD